jgi:hypothetical protein
MSVPVCYKYFDEWGVKMLVPLSFAAASMDDILIQTNGCGREGAEAWIVPDTIWGLEIGPVCRVHDWMYQQAVERARRHKSADKLTADEHFADGVMACNLVGLINQRTGNRLLRWLRLRRAYKYIDAVSLTDLLKVLPEETLVAMGYDTATQALGDMVC